jgi:3'(2'), 5'-bisphosphate nucleotidase
MLDFDDSDGTGRSVTTTQCAWRERAGVIHRVRLFCQLPRHDHVTPAMTVPSDPGLIDQLTTIVSRAAAAILTIRAKALNVRSKADQSPVTAADDASEAIILDELSRLLPGVPIISEEAGAQTAALSVAADVILVDPVDGTRELVAGRNEFTVNLGILRAGRPTLGIIAAPALGVIWRTAPSGGAQRLQLAPGAPASSATQCAPIHTRPRPKSGIIAAVSRSHFDPATDAFLARLGDVTRLAEGSAIKFCHVAEGTADLYPRLAPTFPWDVVAGHAILLAAGGAVTTPDRVPLTYCLDTDRMRIPGFVAWGDPVAPT